MRDRNRIKRILKLIEILWTIDNDQRLGQFLFNHVFGHHVDTYNQEDDVTEERLIKSL